MRSQIAGKSRTGFENGNALGAWRMAALIPILALSAGTAFAQAQMGGDHRSHNLLGESVGAAGHDPVGYFPEGGGKPQKGLIKYTQEFEGVIYRFASAENAEFFKKSPQKYLPSFGGWCAWAVGAIDKRVDVDPESFVIREGKLYLFYRDKELDTRALWLKDTEQLLKKAIENWPALAK